MEGETLSELFYLDQKEASKIFYSIHDLIQSNNVRSLPGSPYIFSEETVLKIITSLCEKYKGLNKWSYAIFIFGYFMGKSSKSINEYEKIIANINNLEKRYKNINLKIIRI